MSHRRNEFEIEQTIFLGGQVSNKHKDFLEIARLSPDYAEMYMIMKEMPKLEKMDDETCILRIIEISGEVDFIRQCSELTRLSAILGDTRKRYSMKDVKQNAPRSIENTSKP